MDFLPNFSQTFILLCILIFLHSPKANAGFLYIDCPTGTNYTTGSSFQANLNLLLGSLSSATATAAGFLNDTKGEAPGQVHGLVLCRGDVSATVCQSCLSDAAQDITQRCPHGVSATIWYDECLLRYDNSSFFSEADTSFKLFMSNTANVSDPQTFNIKLGSLMDGLTIAASRDSSKLFAAGEVNLTSFTKVYGLVQCTRDLSSERCYFCLSDAVGNIPNCCDGKKGGRVFGRSCDIRFEVYPFYSISATEATPAPPPPAIAALPPPPPSTENRSAANGGNQNSSVKKILFVAIPAASVVLLMVVVVVYALRRKAPTQIFENEGQDEIRSSESLLFDLSRIKLATDNFSDRNKLGEGGFGPVYKGTLEDGQNIAVKRLSKGSGQGLVELKNEVVLLAKLQHRNLVRLLGCCLEEEEKLLVYEFLPNTSLDKFLFDQAQRYQLNWGRRYKIIKGIGRGLLYLHEDSRLKIVHRDLKASNILLDGNMNPKISDFGLAKLFSIDETQGNTNRIAGTYGYMAPEYALHGLFSTKSDVFSYGVLVLEILTGRKNSHYQGSGCSIDLITSVWQHWNQKKVLQVIDQSMVDQCKVQEVIRCMHIGLLCIQADPAQRPSMDSVILMLNSQSVTLPIPSEPAFVLHSTTLNERNGLEQNARLSQNDMSMSDMEPR